MHAIARRQSSIVYPSDAVDDHHLGHSVDIGAPYASCLNKPNKVIPPNARLCYDHRMVTFMFRSVKEPDVFGFTADASGGNLPGELGPWRRAGVGTAARSYAGGSLDGLASSDPVIKAVERDGFYLARSGLTISAAAKLGSIHPSN